MAIAVAEPAGPRWLSVHQRARRSSMKHTRLITVIALATLLLAAAASAQDWSNWRGPHYNGSSDESGLPVKFSPNEKVRWATALPGPSAATPIIWKDLVFVSSTDPATQQ